jgi:hypothetical protein
MKSPIFGLTVGTRDAVKRAKEFGINFVDLHFRDDEKSLLKAIEELDCWHIKFTPNSEGAPINYTPSLALRNDLEKSSGFLGFLLDEADHMQINAHWPLIAYYGYREQHYLAETEGLSLFEAQQIVFEALKRRNQACRLANQSAIVEHLFPVMMHTVAKAGLNLSPKILKETCGPAMLAVAMGAARQYNVDFWIDVDYWWHNETLGHSVERFTSALLLAYWSGASRIYVEGGAQWSKGHPLGQEIENTYKHFIQEYIPTHPRSYDWHCYQPKIAIIRYDDTCFDQRQGYLGEYPGPLYGHVPAKYENYEWLNIWSLLSHGFIRTDSLSHQWESRRFYSRTLFVPLDNVVVYDHEVSIELLSGIKLIFLSGMKINPQTFEAVASRVQAGAVCVLPPRLAPLSSGFNGIKKLTIVPDGIGRWIVVPEFYRLHYECFYAGPAQKLLRDNLAGLTGDGDHLVYDFGEYQAIFSQKGGDYPKHEIMTCYLPLTQSGANPDHLEVEITSQ